MKIGLRIPGAARQLPFETFCQWCRDTGFQSVDLGAVTPEAVATAARCDLEIGTADLPGTRDLLSPDAARQEQGIAAARAAIEAAAALGIRRLFCVFVPEDRNQSRARSFEIWKETFPPVVATAAARGVRIAMEGWPGPGPTYPALGCTPETWRAMFAVCPDPAFGLNYDPSHLLRLGIDPFRALDEFGDRVVHAHGKDTEIDVERLYEHGNIGPTFRKPKPFGESWWRYTIPGEGSLPWGRLIARLEDHGFDGVIAVELEDYRYHGSWEREAEGLRRSRDYLAQWVR